MGSRGLRFLGLCENFLCASKIRTEWVLFTVKSRESETDQSMQNDVCVFHWTVLYIYIQSLCGQLQVWKRGRGEKTPLGIIP